MSPRISIRLLNAQSDQRLVALAREGHERAFEALVHRYRRPLLRYARRMRLSEARAEDVLQQSFMQSWIALSRGVVVQDVRGWLYRIVHNTAVNGMRGPAAAHAELTQAVQDRAGLHAASNLERTVAMRDALGHVAALPDMQRQAIFLTAVDGQSHEEVAGTLGISTGALRGLLYRARHTLRSAAAALTPQPLLELAARGGAEGTAPGVERIAELATGSAGAAGFAGVLLKGGVAVLTTGVLASSAVLATYEHHASRAAHSRGPTSVTDVARTARPQTASEPAFPPIATAAPFEHAARVRHGEGQRGGRGRQSGAAHGPDDNAARPSEDLGSGPRARQGSEAQSRELAAGSRTAGESGDGSRHELSRDRFRRGLEDGRSARGGERVGSPGSGEDQAGRRGSDAGSGQGAVDGESGARATDRSSTGEGRRSQDGVEAPQAQSAEPTAVAGESEDPDRSIAETEKSGDAEEIGSALRN